MKSKMVISWSTSIASPYIDSIQSSFTFYTFLNILLYRLAVIFDKFIVTNLVLTNYLRWQIAFLNLNLLIELPDFSCNLRKIHMTSDQFHVPRCQFEKNMMIRTGHQTKWLWADQTGHKRPEKLLRMLG